jgi:hypothetical protein
MVTELQFVAVAAFLIWGLAASLCGVLTAAPDTARLVRRHGDVEPQAPLPEPDEAAGIFMSDHIAVAADNPSQDAQAT